MAKKTKKLSVKKETLRTLGGEELRRVAGAYEALLKSNVVLQPAPVSLVGFDSSDVCQSGIIGGGATTVSCIRVATRCYEP